MKQRLQVKIANKTATICIVGMGYVGLQLMLRFAESGYRSIFDNVVKA